MNIISCGPFPPFQPIFDVELIKQGDQGRVSREAMVIVPLYGVGIHMIRGETSAQNGLFFPNVHRSHIGEAAGCG
jgi:hypothetical protein